MRKYYNWLRGTLCMGTCRMYEIHSQSEVVWKIFGNSLLFFICNIRIKICFIFILVEYNNIICVLIEVKQRNYTAIVTRGRNGHYIYLIATDTYGVDNTSLWNSVGIIKILLFLDNWSLTCQTKKLKYNTLEITLRIDGATIVKLERHISRHFEPYPIPLCRSNDSSKI